MAYSAILQNLDRLTVRSIMRGSTATIAGLIGTLTVIVLCLAIYIPPTNSIVKGSYFESEFYTAAIPSQQFVSNKDFKIAVAFRSKINNSLANHSQIFEYAFSLAVEYLADYSNHYYEPMKLCSDSPHYFDDIPNFQPPSDCFIFPEYAVFSLFMAYGSYSDLEYQMYPRDDPNPFVSAGGLDGYQSRVAALLQSYYYEVYFTSKVIKADGSSSFVMNRFYSTSAEPTSMVATSWNQIVYNIRNTTMDISIMPWSNFRNASNLVWLGQMFNVYLFDLTNAGKEGVVVALSEYLYQLRSFRYYKKLDFLLGIIGGAMLLFYLILWVPCNYINKTLHQIRNAQYLLLEFKGGEEDPVTIQTLFPISVSWRYWVSNPVLNHFFPSLKKEAEVIEEGERELDVVALIKRLKVVERSLKKKGMYSQFEPKVLKLKVEYLGTQQKQLANQSSDQVQSENMEGLGNIPNGNLVIRESYFEEDEVDHKFGLTITHLNYIEKSQKAGLIYSNNMTGQAMRKDGDKTLQLKEVEEKNKWSAHHDERRRPSKVRTIFNFICELIEKVDFFGARPNLNASPHGSSFVGLCGVGLIILMTILTVFATLGNTIPRVMILEQFLPQNNFSFSLTPGANLKFAFCSGYISYLKGSNRYGLFRFFYENGGQRTYFNPVQLTSSDYALFDLTQATSPVNINYCFGMQPSSPIALGEAGSNHGFFGFRIEPYCASTPSFCQSTLNTSNTNFLTFMNGATIYLFLPENRFDPDSQKFVNNLVEQRLNINNYYMNASYAMEETVYVDHVQIQDDTKNWFMRKEPIVPFEGIAINPNTPYPLSRMVNSSSLYYQVKIRPSSLDINYFVTSPKADTILGMIGGIIVLWYSIFHWLGKVYNNFQVRAAQADAIYAEDIVDESVFMKFLALSPLPLCLFPSCYDIKNTITRIREVDKKVLNDLNYLWLVKYVNNIFDITSTLFGTRRQEQNLSKVFIKEKIDESSNVLPQVEEKIKVRETDLMEIEQYGLDKDMRKTNFEKKSNKVADESELDKSQVKMEEKSFKLVPNIHDPNSRYQEFSQNYISGQPKPFKLAWMDTFEYQPSLTFKGKRQVTSCCGGCCCLILLIFIIIIVNFQLGIYFSRSDTKVGMTTGVMQPLANISNPHYNSNITLHTGSDFKLAVTFSSRYADFPHNVTSIINQGIGVSIFQKTFDKVNGSVLTTIQEYPMVPCKSGYLTGSISSLIDAAYYSGEELGYCAPDGVTLYISGIPEDNTKKTFTLSIYNKYNTTNSSDNYHSLLYNYYPKFHYTVPNKDYITRQVTYEIASIVFTPYNITRPVQQNLSLSKTILTYDDEIGFSTDPFVEETYNVNEFRQMEVGYTGLITETLYYNLTFENSYLVEHYVLEGDKFYETFGIVGGLIAFFIFGFGCIASSFNSYRMRYLIGRELYLFEISKKRELRNAVRGKVRKTHEQVRELSHINNLNELNILRAYLLSFIGGVWQNYNFDPILRRVTLIQQKVEKDISLFSIYKKLHSFRDTLNAHYDDESGIKPADIYLKHVYNPDPREAPLDGMQKVKGYAKKHNWTAFEQFAIQEAKEAHINLKDVFDSAFLERAFDIDESITNAHLSNINPTVMTNSINSEAMSNIGQED